VHLRRISYVPTAEELYSLFKARYFTIGAKSPSVRPGIERLRRLEIVRIVKSGKFLAKSLRSIALNMPFLKELHPFYRDLIGLLLNGSEYKHALAKIGNSHRAIKSIAKDAIMAVKIAEDRGSILRARSMFLARVGDLLRDLSPELNYLREAVKVLRRLPQVDPESFTVVVAGVPNVGKSSFVRCVSTAEPEVAEYPFTTREIHVGHVVVDKKSRTMFQVIDTPGLLDRPLSERNKIELQAVLALKHLANLIVFVLDPTLHSGQTLDSQLNLLKEIKENFQVPILVVVNKKDIATREELERALSRVGEDAFLISALECDGVKEVVDHIVNNYFLPLMIKRLRESRVADRTKQ